MEDIKIKEKRKEKYLSKMQNPNQNYRNLTNSSTLINNNTPIQDNDSFNENNKISESYRETKPYQRENLIDSNNNINNDSEKKIDYNSLFQKIIKFSYIKSLLNFLKKVFIIIISIFHCLNYYGLGNILTFRYTLLILEISSLLIELFIENRINNLKDIQEIQDNTAIKDLKSIFAKDRETFQALKSHNYFFLFLQTIEEIFVDISILFVTNFIFFIINEEND